MGTSISHRSPSTPNWRAASLAYTHDEVPIDRAVQEIWRAATNQPIGDLAADLGSPPVATCLQIAMTADSPDSGLREAVTKIALSGEVSLATDLAQRAMVQSLMSTEDRVGNFSRRLFAEAVDYLVSRDLSGYVGRSERVKNVSSSIEFKRLVRASVEESVRSVPVPEGVGREPARWRDYVSDVVTRLTGKD